MDRRVADEGPEGVVVLLLLNLNGCTSQRLTSGIDHSDGEVAFTMAIDAALSFGSPGIVVRAWVEQPRERKARVGNVSQPDQFQIANFESLLFLGALDRGVDTFGVVVLLGTKADSKRMPLIGNVKRAESVGFLDWFPGIVGRHRNMNASQSIRVRRKCPRIEGDAEHLESRHRV